MTLISYNSDFIISKIGIKIQNFDFLSQNFNFIVLNLTFISKFGFNMAPQKISINQDFMEDMVFHNTTSPHAQIKRQNIYIFISYVEEVLKSYSNSKSKSQWKLNLDFEALKFSADTKVPVFRTVQVASQGSRPCKEGYYYISAVCLFHFSIILQLILHVRAEEDVQSPHSRVTTF